MINYSGVQNLITSVRNGYMAGKRQIDIYNGPMMKEIVSQMSRLGFVDVLHTDGKRITLRLLYKESSSGRTPLVKGIHGISTTSRRIYWKYRDLGTTEAPNCVYILSTPKGILMHTEGLKHRTGGEALLCIC